MQDDLIEALFSLLGVIYPKKPEWKYKPSASHIKIHRQRDVLNIHFPWLIEFPKGLTHLSGAATTFNAAIEYVQDKIQMLKLQQVNKAR